MIESSLSLAIQHIESKIKESSNASARVKSETDILIKELKDVQKLLRHAEARTTPKKILSTSHEVRRLFTELSSIANTAEDEVDTLVIEYSTLPNYLRFSDHRALKKLRRLTDHAKEVKRKLERHFDGSNKGTLSPARSSQSPKGHLPPDEDLVIGIDQEINKVVDLVTRKSKAGHEPVDKLAIVGMGGSGKTTLARSIYNHKVVKKHFQFHAWVSASQIRDPSLLLLDILTQIRSQKSRFSLFSLSRDDEEPEDESSRLVSRIKSINDLLNQKNCLLVLDDVWDFESLYMFINLIQDPVTNSPRYTIIITSRQTPSKHWSIHQPQPLTDEKCWELFSKAASKNPSEPLNNDYRSLAMEMLARCQGLPLAIVALARLLRTKDTPREWQRVCSRVTGTDATTMYGPVNEILGLSYDQLPYYLKPCFLYLGLFPEDSQISGATLIRMWIAEGFIIESSSEETEQVAGKRYLQELIDHTMVQVVRKTYSGKVKTITIHDLMRDFCISRAKNLDFLGVSDSGPAAIGKTSRRGAINLSKTLILPADSANLRTLALFGQSSRGARERYSSQVNHRYLNMVDVCRMYRLLRVMDIFGINSIDGTLPKEIGDLVHLTYLRIRSTNIRQLPKSIGNLSNLLTLDYWDVFTDSEIKVPNVLWKLKKLRHLYLPNEMRGSIEALKLHTLKNLITLWGVGGGRWMLKEMERLSSTLSKLYIHRISDEKQLKAVLGCTKMMENKNLYALALDWYSFENKSLDALALKESLKKLRLIGKAPDKSYSDGHQFPSNLGKLELYYTQLENQKTMTHLGNLVSLKVLRLSKDSYIGSEWTCDCDAFPVLEELKLTNLQKLEDWIIEEGAFPCLKKLSIISCTKLKRIPKGLVNVRCLEKLDIERMPSSFVTKLQKVKEWNDETVEGEDYHIVKHIQKVLIRDSSAF